MDARLYTGGCGWPFPDGDFHPARYAELLPARYRSGSGACGDPNPEEFGEGRSSRDGFSYRDGEALQDRLDRNRQRHGQSQIPALGPRIGAAIGKTRREKQGLELCVRVLLDMEAGRFVIEVLRDVVWPVQAIRCHTQIGAVLSEHAADAPEAVAPGRRDGRAR